MNTKRGTSDKDTPPPTTLVELDSGEVEMLADTMRSHLVVCSPKANAAESGHFGIEEPLLTSAPTKYSCTHCGNEIAHVYGQLKGMRE